MTENYHLIINTIHPSIKAAFSYPIEKQRYLWFTDKLKQQGRNEWENISYTDKEDVLIYSETKLQVRMGNNLYPKRVSKRGFSFDKKTKKLQMWYMSQPSELAGLDSLLLLLKHEWVVQEGFSKYSAPTKRGVSYSGWLTKGLLEKILAGKITNPKSACEFIIRHNRLKGVSPEKLRKFIKNNGSKMELLMVFPAITNVNEFLEENETIHSGYIIDTLKQAKALGKKIDLRWSSNRMMEIHQEFTQELMGMELDMMDDYEIVYDNPIPLPTGFELIRSKKRLFQEGKLMNHCVFTNYWNKVEQKDYLVLHVEDEDKQVATAGIRLSHYGITLDQVKAPHNRTPSKKIQTMVHNLMNEENFLYSLRQEFEIKGDRVNIDEEYENLPF